MVVKEAVQLEGDLYAIQWEGDKDHCLNMMLDTYSDAQFLRNLFKTNSKFKASGPFSKKSIESMVSETMKGTSQMLKDITDDSIHDLDSLFKPLKGNKLAFEFEPKKFSGYSTFSWIRVYAVKDDQDCFFITGFAIKFSQTMQGHPLTTNELDKIAIVDKFIKENPDLIL